MYLIHFTGNNSKYRITMHRHIVMTGSHPEFKLFDRVTQCGTITTNNMDRDDSKTKVIDMYVVVRMTSSTGGSGWIKTYPVGSEPQLSTI